MQNIDITIPINIQSGNKYILEISNMRSFDIDIDLPIMNVNLVMFEKEEKISAIKELTFISREIIKFLKNNNVLLYYYCDNKPILRSKKNDSISPQKYRFDLFSALYKLCLKDDVIVEAEITHYISLISRKENKESLTKVTTEIEKLNDKE